MSGRYRGASAAGAKPFTLDAPPPISCAGRVPELRFDDRVDQDRIDEGSMDEDMPDRDLSHEDPIDEDTTDANPDSFLARAMEWDERDINVLDYLLYDLSALFQANANEVEMRTAYEELLYRERLPSLYRT